MSHVFASSAVYLLCLSLPVVIVEQITGLWGILERAVDAYLAESANNMNFANIYEWAQSYPYQANVSLATWFFLVLVPGPLTLGLSIVWLRLLRGHAIFTDMVFSGFGNFLRAALLNLTRFIFIILWAILFIIPGLIAYYRYSLAFFLLADNPSMSPFSAITLSKYYMRQNKGNRFFLDLSFIGWFILAAITLFFSSSMVLGMIEISGYTITLFINQLVNCVLGAVIMAPLYAYRGVAAAEYYHRAICKDPAGVSDPLKLPGV